MENLCTTPRLITSKDNLPRLIMSKENPCITPGLITSKDNLIGLIMFENNLHIMSGILHSRTTFIPSHMRSHAFVSSSLLPYLAWEHASIYYVTKKICISDHTRTRHSLFRGISFWITPSLSLKYSNFTLDSNMVNTSSI